MLNQTESLVYAPVPHIQSAIEPLNGEPPPANMQDTILVCKRCEDAVVYYTAALLLIAYNEAEKAKIFSDLSNELMK